MKKNLLKVILIGIPLCALCALIVFFVYKGTHRKPGKPPAPVAAVKQMPAPLIEIPVQKNVISKVDAKYIKDDLNSILDTSKMFVKQGDFGKTFTDMGAVLALNNNSDLQKNTLARFMKNALRGLAANTDIETIKGLIVAIASIDRSALQGKNSVSEGLIQPIERNMYGQLRKTADVKTSSLRSFLFMLKVSDINLNLKILGINTHIPLLYFLDSPDHPKGQPGTVSSTTKNLAAWSVGEIVTAQEWGRQGKIELDGKYATMDRFQALDWVLYKKTYRFKAFGIPVPILKFKGLAGMMSSKLVQPFMPKNITDSFPTLVELAGGMTDAEYNNGKYDGFTTTSWKDRYGTAGKRHKLFALFGPIMEFYWKSPYPDGKLRVIDMVAMMAGLNEIDPSDYRPLNSLFGKYNAKATFRQDESPGAQTVMKTLEDRGLLIALLKGKGDDNGGMLGPALDLVIRLVSALNTKDSASEQYKKAHPEFKGNTALDVIFAEVQRIGFKKDTELADRLIDKTITALFEIKKGESKNAVAQLQDLVLALGKAADDKAYMNFIRADLVKIIQAVQNLIYHDDLERVLPAFDKILALNDNTDLQRNTLARFVTRTLHAAAPLSDGATLKGLLLALLSVDKSAMEAHGISEGVIYMAHHNMYAQKRETADINISQLRSFFFLIENADRNMPLTVNGKNTGIDLIRLIDSPDHPLSEPGTVRDQTTNIAQWYIGEMVTAIRWGREGKIMLNGRYVHMNQYQAYDWLLYKKRYQLAGIGRIPLNFTGVNGILNNDIVKSFLPPGAKDTVTTLSELGGGMTDAEYAGGSYNGFTLTSWKNRYGTGGRRHKVLALFNPILEFLWNAHHPQGGQRSGDFVRLIRGMNEMSVADYQPLFKDGVSNRNATLRHDDQFNGKSVIKIIEDSRLLSIVSRSHGPNDNGLLAPALDLLIRIVAKLNEKDSAPADYRKNNPGFRGNTALDVLFAEMKTRGFTSNSGDATELIEKVNKLLFVPQPDETQNLVAQVHGYVKILEQTVAIFREPDTHKSTTLQTE
ncbi:MAG: hypothetical protein NTW65_09060 [Deltaproteobacteria bacterium]|nr:hypothetical protein [Deltaproteobacteria bacterium]